MHMTIRGSFFLAALTLIFVIAKLLGLVAWSWWLVFLPVLLPWAVGLAIFAAAAVIGGLILIVGGIIMAYDKLLLHRRPVSAGILRRWR
jgi:hypothetical protein